MMNKSSLLIFSTLILCGCTNQKFDCPYTDGVRCKSLSEVDQQVNQGKIGNISKKSETKKLTFVKAPDSPLRSQEEVLSIWVAPYQTEDGTLHEEKIMHFVAKPAEWVSAVNEVVEEENVHPNS